MGLLGPPQNRKKNQRKQKPRTKTANCILEPKKLRARARARFKHIGSGAKLLWGLQGLGAAAARMTDGPAGATTKPQKEPKKAETANQNRELHSGAKEITRAGARKIQTHWLWSQTAVGAAGTGGCCCSDDGWACWGVSDLISDFNRILRICTEFKVFQ